MKLNSLGDIKSPKKPDGSQKSETQLTNDEQKMKNLNKILKLKRKSTIDNVGLRSNKLLVPKTSQYTIEKHSSTHLTGSSRGDRVSFLCLKNEITRDKGRMNSIIMSSITLNKNNDPTSEGRSLQ